MFLYWIPHHWHTQTRLLVCSAFFFTVDSASPSDVYCTFTLLCDTLILRCALSTNTPEPWCIGIYFRHKQKEQPLFWFAVGSYCNYWNRSLHLHTCTSTLCHWTVTTSIFLRSSEPTMRCKARIWSILHVLVRNIKLTLITI